VRLLLKVFILCLGLSYSFSAFAVLVTSDFNSEGELENSPASSPKSRLRIQNYSEFMTPALQGDGASVPDASGNALTGASLDGRVWTDYELASNWKLLYWQRYPTPSS
jgi:hypothetical protein